MVANNRIALTAKASADFDDIIDYIALNHSETLATKIYIEFNKAFDIISRHPYIGHKRPIVFHD